MSDPSLGEYVRRLVGYTRWADERLLDAARGLDESQFEGIRGRLLHMLGTYGWWGSLWSGGAWSDPSVHTLDEVRAAFASVHDALASRFADADESALAVSKEWWKQWGEDGSLPVADTLVQVALHAVQHRSEIAVILTEAGCSPGDLDYLGYIVPIANPSLRRAEG